MSRRYCRTYLDIFSVPANKQTTAFVLFCCLALCLYTLMAAKMALAEEALFPRASEKNSAKKKRPKPALAGPKAEHADPASANLSAWHEGPLAEHRHGIEAKTQRYTLNVEYPSFGAPKIDAELALWARRQVDTFTRGLDAIPAEDSSHYTLAITYQYIQPSLNCTSVIFYISTETGGAQPDLGMATFVYDMHRGKQLAYPGIFTENRGLTPFLSAYCQKAISRQPWAREHMARVTSGTSPDIINFTFFAVSTRGLTVYFPPGQAGPISQGTLSVEIPLEELRAYQPALALWENTSAALKTPTKP